MTKNITAYDNAVAMYHALPDYVRRSDVAEAIDWARKTLTDKEGSGHQFYLSTEDGKFVCSFAKPEWAGDHCSAPYFDAEKAIIMAVCEYLSGA
jgi:hypothetical protein